MAPSPILKPLAYFLSVSGLLQGLLWFVLGVLSLITYNGGMEIPVIAYPQGPTHNDFIAQMVKGLYFADNDYDLSVDQNALAVFMGLYVAISVLWSIASGLLFYFARFAKWSALRKSLVVYSVIVIGVTVLDLTLMSMLVVDYRKANDLMLRQGVSLETTYLLLVIGMMFTLAARGYVLLLLNLVCVVYSLITYFTSKSDCTADNRILYNMPIEAYKDYSGDCNFVEAVNEEPNAMSWSQAQNNHGFIPDQWVTQPVTHQEQPQRHYTPEPEEQPVPRRQDPITSLYAKPMKVVPVPKPPPPMPPPKPAKKAAKPPKPQGKKGPPIPFPDYTPPASPTDLRSVIKPQSSYY